MITLMEFTKMHGAGNDYVYVNGFAERVEDPPDLARKVSDRHTGIGSDGLIIIRPPSDGGTDCRMEMYNADGSRAQMCGNGIRCVAKYVYDRGIARRPVLRIDTDAGRKVVRVLPAPGGGLPDLAESLEVDMGSPRLARASIPLVDGGDPREPAIDIPIDVGDRSFRLTAVSMGNPHAVVRLEDVQLDAIPVAEWGAGFEHHSWFPQRVNTEFIRIRSRKEIDFRVWERGSGETLACGTGACAAAVAAAVNGWCDLDVVVHLRGGDLRIRWEAPGGAEERRRGGGTVFMTGPAVEVFSGVWPG